jgi:hypothetical protein
MVSMQKLTAFLRANGGPVPSPEELDRLLVEDLGATPQGSAPVNRWLRRLAGRGGDDLVHGWYAVGDEFDPRSAQDV